jgi:hypothetical protein
MDNAQIDSGLAQRDVIFDLEIEMHAFPCHLL